MIEQDFPACLVLAAGRSQRMGQDKLSLKLPSGITVLEQTLKNLEKIPFCDQILVVRSRSTLGFSLDAHPFRVLEIGDDADLGMHRSLKLGLQNLQIMPEAAMICLADQPLLTALDYLQIWEKYLGLKKNKIGLLQPVSSDRKGNPCLIHRDFFPEIFREADSDRGARYLFERHKERAYFWETKNPRYFLDFDTPEDWRNYFPVSPSQ